MNAEELFWKFAEGKCSPDEMAAVEKLLANDPAMRAELDSMLEVQTALAGMGSDSPSMRFTQNVMEGLPANLYPPLGWQSPLVSPVWKKIFWLGLAGMAGGVFLLPRSSGGGLVGPALRPYSEKMMDGIGGTVGQLPPVAVQFFAITLVCLLLLGLLDRYFSARIQGWCPRPMTREIVTPI